jgi:maltooligosyltrehalose trehalohydrolase
MDQMLDTNITSRRIGREQEMKFGTQITANGVRFRLWAPEAKSLSVKIEERDLTVVMHALPRGWFETEITGVVAGDRYRFVLDDGTKVPDPASRFQPEDVHGPSEIVDPRAYRWADLGWRGRPWEEAVIYELHVGTFTREGTFEAAIDKLDHLAALGVTAIELMPIADFHGRYNWGYDGALLFAPDATYGRPDDLKAFIDAAHASNLMVILDVVYNHFGPTGNYLSIYAPVMTEKHHTPWGPAVNYDDEGSHMIRDFVMANARYWLNEYHFDGLRFDAVHAIDDSGPKHMLQDLAEQVRAATDGRHIHLIAENELNQANWLTRRPDGTPGLYTAQWSDDIHHALHVYATGETFSYYARHAGRIDLLGRALAEGLAFQGEITDARGRTKGEPSAFLPATAFIAYIQTHDQIGNRPFGERIAELASRQAIRAIAAIYLLSPHIPMLFMGEEWGTTRPFLYFSDVGEELAASIREGRQKEMENIPELARGDESPPDPMAEESFAASKLDWAAAETDEGRDMFAFYQRLLEIRRTQIAPRLVGISGNSGSYEVIGPRALRVSWQLGDGATLAMISNLSGEPLGNVDVWAEDHLWLEGFATGNTLEPWSVVFRLTPPVQHATA